MFVQSSVCVCFVVFSGREIWRQDECILLWKSEPFPIRSLACYWTTSGNPAEFTLQSRDSYRNLRCTHHRAENVLSSCGGTPTYSLPLSFTQTHTFSFSLSLSLVLAVQVSVVVSLVCRLLLIPFVFDNYMDKANQKSCSEINVVCVFDDNYTDKVRPR